jgi:hydroxyethylthiazole kinase-like uncharacterized protein yjeF
MTDIPDTSRLAVLSPAQMYEADRLTIEAGTPGLELMENAGGACARAIAKRYRPGRAVVLCGLGNNGGDGFVIARHLAKDGWQVTLHLLGDVAKLKGDAALMAKKWRGEVKPLGEADLKNTDLIVDALFGAGLDRAVTGTAAELIIAAHGGHVPVMAVDMPSGIDGRSGAVRGVAFDAGLTVTFFRKKPGHLLMPGRGHCGETLVVDIGIDVTRLAKIAPQDHDLIYENAPGLWRENFPTPRLGGHKYGRGHAISVSGGMRSTGAARLAAMAALRCGAGLVTVASPASALVVNASHLTAIMLARAETDVELARMLDDRRKNAVVIGPGCGVGGKTRGKVRAVLASGVATVLDADGLTSFAQTPEALFEAIGELPERPVVLTPHSGEFKHIFNGLAGEDDSKTENCRKAAAASGAVVVAKGPDTVIGAPDGRCVINANAPPTLATAGSGDVLAGIICGLLAQGMPGFEAACAAGWLHGAAGDAFGPGLIAEDIISMLPAALPLAFREDR